MYEQLPKITDAELLESVLPYYADGVGIFSSNKMPILSKDTEKPVKKNPSTPPKKDFQTVVIPFFPVLRSISVYQSPPHQKRPSFQKVATFF